MTFHPDFPSCSESLRNVAVGSVITWNNALTPNVFYRLKVWEALYTDSGERKQAKGLEGKEIMATMNMVFFVLIGHIFTRF